MCGAEMTLYGDKKEFAIEFSFEKDPDGGGFESPEITASWGQWALWTKGKNLCRHISPNGKSGVCVERVSWYLLPLIEWLCENWRPLFSEQKPPMPFRVSNAHAMGMEYTQRRFFGTLDYKADEKWFKWRNCHALRSCRNGGLFPDVFFRGHGENVEISWGANPLPGTPDGFQFLEPGGVALSDRESVTTTCKNFMLGALDGLSQMAPASARLADLRNRVDALVTGKIPDLDFYTKFGDRREKIFDKLRKVLPEISWDNFLPAPILMFGTLSPNIDERDIDQILQYIKVGVSNSLRQQQHTRSIPDVPYQAGYELAEDFLVQHSEFLSENSSYVNIESIIGSLEITRHEVDLEDGNLRGVALAGQGLTPTILVNRRSSYNRDMEGKRYTMAHELCHLLYDQEFGREVGVASGNWAPQYIERRANAFAGMLLMPPTLIDRHLSRYGNEFEWTLEIFKNLKESLQVSTSALMEHLSNLSYIDMDVRGRLDMELDAEYGSWAGRKSTRDPTTFHERS
jgi:Zn-dependent peptidase ImmA (M78 family)